jgi:hypothetical protein
LLEVASFRFVHLLRGVLLRAYHDVHAARFLFWAPALVQHVLITHVPRAMTDGLGVPLYIGATLWANRAAMRRDIRLWQRGLGDTPETNPDYWVRRRYSRLYIDYKPHAHWWRLVLIVRKGCLVAVSVCARACVSAACSSLRVRLTVACDLGVPTGNVCGEPVVPGGGDTVAVPRCIHDAR